MDTDTRPIHPKDRTLFALIDEVLAEYERTKEGLRAHECAQHV